MSNDDPRQVRHTVIIVRYQCPLYPLFSSCYSPSFIFGSMRDDLLRRSYENSNAFVRRPSAVRPSLVTDDVILLVLISASLPLYSPTSSQTSNRRDVYHWFLEITATDRSPRRHIVESRVTVFTSDRRGEYLRLFKSFYYAISIYIHDDHLFEKSHRDSKSSMSFQFWLVYLLETMSGVFSELALIMDLCRLC